MDTRQTQLSRRFHKCRNIIDKNSFAVASIHRLKRGFKDVRRRFAGAEGAGIDSSSWRKVAVKAVGCFQVGNVDGIRVRQEGKPVTPRELLEERFVLHWLWVESEVPRLRKFFQG